MKSISLSDEDVLLLKSGKLEKICLPLEPIRDESGMTFDEACSAYKKGESKISGLTKQLLNQAIKTGEKIEVSTSLLAQQYLTPYEDGEEILPYCDSSDSPIGRPLKVVSQKANKEENLLEIYVSII